MTVIKSTLCIDGPVHTHDCDYCTYLGSFSDHVSKHPYDYYFCKYPSTKSEGSCVVRYGSDYWQYESMPVRCLDFWHTLVDNEKIIDAVPDVPLYYCYRLAQERGLIKE